MKKDCLKQSKSLVNRKPCFFEKVSTSKIPLIVALVIIFSAILLVSINFVFRPQNNSVSSDEIYYYPANYDEDIFKNKAYLGYEKGIMYSEANVTKLYQMEDFESAPLPCQFFLDYFQTVISGKYQEISKFYVDGYFEVEPKFTMQMIYDSYVNFHSVSKEEIDGEETELYNFTVRYKIFKNNGTFRRGIASNAAIPQIYQLRKINDSYQIFRILDVEYENES